MRDTVLFRNLSDGEYRLALETLEAAEKEYAKGEILIRPDTVFTAFGLVKKGTVQISRIDRDGNAYIMARAGKNSYFGESMAFLRNRTCVIVSAVEKCTVVWFKTDFITNNKPKSVLENKLISNYISLVSERALTLNDRIQLLSVKNTAEKVVRFLSDYEKEKGKPFKVPYTREAMAGYLGVNRSALSKVLSELRNKGKIDFQKNIFTLKT